MPENKECFDELEKLKDDLRQCQEKNIQLEKELLKQQYEKNVVIKENAAMKESMLLNEIKRRFPEMIKDDKNDN